jgi:cobalamin biosynthesis Mg chelatase CobN
MGQSGDWAERAVESVARMLRAIETGEWTPDDTDGGDVAKAIARKAVELVEIERRFAEGLI